MTPRTERAQDGILFRTFQEADRLRRDALDKGASREDANAIVARALFEAWPRGREEPWVYLCESCEDTGWRIFDCAGDSVCGRRHKHAVHTYAQPCHCAKGQGFIPQARTETSELAAVGRSKPKKRGFGSWTAG